MKIRYLNAKAFSLLEVLLAAIVFIISVGGIFATLNAVRTPVSQKESGLTAALFGKQVLEALRAQVNDPQTAAALKNYYNCSVAGDGTAALPCPDFALSVGYHQVKHGNLPAGISWPPALLLVPGNIACDALGCLNYTVICANGGACTTDSDVAHRVDLHICLDAAC